MKTLSMFSPGDGLTETLLRLSVSSSLYCVSEMTAPWGFRVAARPQPVFHLVTAGSAWLEVDGEPEPTWLETGDLVIVPLGSGHLVRDSRTSSVQWLDGILEQSPPVNGRLNHGGGGPRTELLCGGFEMDQLVARPMLRALPRVVVLHGTDGHSPEWLAGLVRMITIELASNGPGAEAVVTRLSDALLAQALRHALTDDAVAAAGSPVMADPVVARALRLMREHLERPWTVPALAAAVALSRSSFAGRFKDVTRETPMRYLARQRLLVAADYLRTSDAGLKEIARRTGYDSEVSISKAFRRMYGVSPGAYRKGHRPASREAASAAP